MSHGPQASDQNDGEDEHLFDAFLEAALDGSDASPEAFLDARGIHDATKRAALLEQLQGIQRLATPAVLSPDLGTSTAGAHAPPVEDGLHEDELDGRIGEYRLIRRLGAGAMGEVFLAEQSSLGRLVALKTQRAHLALSPTAAARFEREAKALGQINHAGVVRIHDFGQDGELLYLAMELLPGRSLKERLETARDGEGPPTPLEISQWGLQLAAGLEAAHRAGLVHRDVKPGNVRIVEGEAGSDDRAVLVDFGLARLAEPSDLSHTGEFLGSPAYASPEQIRGDADLDERSDIYSLGATLYHALCGSAPFQGENLEAVLHAVLSKEPETLQKRNSALPRDLALVVHKAMEKQPGHRYATAHDLVEDLRAVLELRPVTAKPRGPIGRAVRWAQRNRPAAFGLGAAAISLLLAVGYVAESSRRDELATQQRAEQMLTDAELALVDFRVGRETLVEEEREFEWLWTRTEYGHLGKQKTAKLHDLDMRVRRAREHRDQAFQRGQNLLDSAVRLVPELDGRARDIRRDLLAERLIEANAQDNQAAAAFLTSELERFGAASDQVAGAVIGTELSLHSTRPGTDVWVFRYMPLDELLPGSDWRNVPVPVTLDSTGAFRLETELADFTWGAEVLRVAAIPSHLTTAELREGDLITHMAGFPIKGGPLVTQVAEPNELGLTPGARLVQVGGVPLERAEDLDIILAAGSDPLREFLFQLPARDEPLSATEAHILGLGVEFDSLANLAMGRGGPATTLGSHGVRDLVLPPKLTLRNSVAAPPLAQSNLLPLDQTFVLPPGSYLIVSSAPSAHLTRRTLLCKGKQSFAMDVTPIARGKSPAGFVRIDRGVYKSPSFWIMEREVSSAEYLEFLNQPATLALIDRNLKDGILTRMPKAGLRSVDSYLWLRLDDGQFAMPEQWPTDWPVLGMTYADAVAYCAWRSADDPDGSYRLPTRIETYQAGTGALDQRFSWGERFSQEFANTCFSRPVARPERVFANVRDESPFGVYDSCGNALEWVSDWYDKTRNLRHAIGGSWGQSRLDTLSVEGGMGISEASCSGETGFRMVWVPNEVQPAADTVTGDE